jgi:glycosyltransferase involved in cell wall biosynthesis
VPCSSLASKKSLQLQNQNKNLTERRVLLDFVSIVITTKNEEKNIERCLQSIKGQTYPEHCIEIIVIDNQSNDRTKELAKQYTDQVFDKSPERSAQRNYGILSIAKGDFILFLDADMILSPNLLDECVRTLKEDDYLGLYVSEVILGHGYWCQVRRFERSFYDGTVIDTARFFRKDIFERVGGFDETMSGPEDWDFDKKLRSLGKVGLVKGAPLGKQASSKWNLGDWVSQLGVDSSNYGAVIFHNESEFNLKTYLRKKKYYSQDFDRYIEKWGNKDPDIRRQVGIWYRYFGVYWENGKWIKLFTHPLLSVGMYFLRFLIGMVFVLRKYPA